MTAIWANDRDISNKNAYSFAEIWQKSLKIVIVILRMAKKKLYRQV
jgi:hypothetical protein